MRFNKRLILAAISGAMLIGCVVREVPPRRHYVVVDAPPPPPPPVEVVPVAPGPEFIYTPGIYVREGGGWGWHHGYWHR